MANEIRIGFSIHPRWFGRDGLEAFLDPLRRAGLSALEFELDDQQQDWPAFQPLMKTAFDQGLELSFHAPYREPHTLVGFAGERRQALEDEYYPLLEIAQDWAMKAGDMCHLVVHAAVSRMPSTTESLVADTHAYLEWILETFPNLCLALENNHPPVDTEIKVGIQRADILKLIGWLQQDRLGICWDMGHDYLSNQPYKVPSEWLTKVVHVHVHDVDKTGADHYPLVMGNVPYQHWLQALKKEEMKGIVVLELKGMRMKDWPLDRVATALTDSICGIAREVA